MIYRTAICAAILPALMVLWGCVVGPDYQRLPPASTPAPRYKELAGWTLATPADAPLKSDWWTDFHDPLLNELEPKVRVANQTVQADYQNYQEALAFVREANALLFPVISGTGSATRSRTSAGGSSAGSAFITGSPHIFDESTVEGSLSWALDIWGKVRREIEENEASAQASEATLAYATLSEQVLLATTLIDLRVTDADIDLLTSTVKEYTEYLLVVSNAVKAGYNLYPPSDLYIARVQLETAQSSLISLGVARAEYEHAIAVLVGENPEYLSIPHSTRLPTLPNVPAGVPSTLLQRRPDIAAAERTMAAENAAIGVAIAAYYPSITLSAAGGFAGQPENLFNASDKLWTLAAAGTETIFDFGTRSAEVDAAKALYKSEVATYRGIVLSAFQGVEDNLAALRILAQQAAVLDSAVRNATIGAQVARNEYLAGTVDYTTVATAQVTQLTNEQSALLVQQSRLLDAATLIGDLGGGWSTAQLHDAQHPDEPAHFDTHEPALRSPRL